MYPHMDFLPLVSQWIYPRRELVLNRPPLSASQCIGPTALAPGVFRCFDFSWETTAGPLTKRTSPQYLRQYLKELPCFILALRLRRGCEFWFDVSNS